MSNHKNSAQQSALCKGRGRRFRGVVSNVYSFYAQFKPKVLGIYMGDKLIRDQRQIKDHRKDLKVTEKDRFVFLEHTADAYIAAFGRTLSEAFENAGLALFELMTDLDGVHPKKEDSFEVKAQNVYELLYNWLEALLVRFDTKQMLYSKLKILELNEEENDFWLRAQAYGERFNPQKHVQKVGVKAVTYHRMEIIRKPEKVIAKFILDL